MVRSTSARHNAASDVPVTLLGFLTVQSADASSAPGDFARPFIGWAIFAASLVVAGIGEGIRRAGLRKGI